MPKPTEGFSLLEVMVAIAILAVVTTAVYRLHAQAIMLVEENRFRSLAPLLAGEILATMETEQWPAPDERNGEFGPDQPGYRWTAALTPAALEGLEAVYPRLTTVEVRIWHATIPTDFRLRTLRFN